MDGAVLVVCRAGPYGSERARDALDIAMACGAFDQPTALLFLGDGVYVLARGQQSGAAGARNLGKLIGTLRDYGIEELHVDARALALRDLEAEDLVIPVSLLDDAQIAALYAQYRVVLCP